MLKNGNKYELTLEDVATGVNVAWVLLTGALVFVMQLGFTLLTAGSVRAKNVNSTMLKSLLDSSIGALGWYSFGFAFAFGADFGLHHNNVIGTKYFFLSQGFEEKSSYSLFFFEYVFASTSAAIVSGCTAERTTLFAYVCYTLFLTAFVYPVVAHWMWSTTGWLSPFRIDSENRLFGVGVFDFAGDAAVHMVGGLSGLIGAIFVGPRRGRFLDNGEIVPMPGHSPVLALIGVFMLWFGWYGFNPGSTLAVTNGNYEVAELAAVTTTLAAAAGTIAALLVQLIVYKNHDLVEVMNGSLCGLVAITSGCAVMEPWAAIATGFFSVPVFYLIRQLLFKLRIDDPLQASPMHFGCGAYGLLATGFYADPGKVQNAYRHHGAGAFYSRGESLAAQIVCVLVVSGWVIVCMVPLFWILKKLNLLRIPADEEDVGMDAVSSGAHHRSKNNGNGNENENGLNGYNGINHKDNVVIPLTEVANLNHN